MKTSITIEVEVDYRISPGRKGSRDSCCGVANDGPPLEPDDPSECEITNVMFGQLELLELLDETQLHEIRDACYEDAGEKAANDRDAKAEAQQEQKRQYPVGEGWGSL